MEQLSNKYASDSGRGLRATAARHHRLGWVLLLAILFSLHPTTAQAQTPGEETPATTDPETAADAPTVRRVKVSFFLNSISKIDSKNGAYEIDCYLDFYWFEPALEGKTLADIDPETLWNPVIEPVNSQDYQFKLLGYANSFEPRTNLRLSYRLIGTFFNEFDLAAFPFDRQTFTLQLESGEFDSNQLLFDFIEAQSPTIYGDRPVLYPVPRGKYLAPDFSIPEWTLEDTQVLQLIRVLSYDKSSWAQFRLDLTAVRQWQGYLWRVLFQLFLVQVLFWTVLFIDSQQLSHRLLLLFTLFMLAVIFNLVLLQNVPHTAYLTWLERYLVLTYAAGALIAALVVVISLIQPERSDGWGARLNAQARLGYPVLLLIANGLLLWFGLG
ncbi:MAG: hypothetical protein ACOYNY_12210 [Caldilineaceae bacterium]